LGIDTPAKLAKIPPYGFSRSGRIFSSYSARINFADLAFLDGHPPVDGDGCPVQEGRFIRRGEENGCGNLFILPQPTHGLPGDKISPGFFGIGEGLDSSL
jgi:hypothetical protein